jgi:hypothetical protein
MNFRAPFLGLMLLASLGGGRAQAAAQHDALLLRPAHPRAAGRALAGSGRPGHHEPAKHDSLRGKGLPSLEALNKLCIFAGTIVFGLLGGLLGGALGLEFFSLGGFLLSGLGSMVGVYVGWRVARWLE